MEENQEKNGNAEEEKCKMNGHLVEENDKESGDQVEEFERSVKIKSRGDSRGNRKLLWRRVARRVKTN